MLIYIISETQGVLNINIYQSEKGILLLFILRFHLNILESLNRNRMVQRETERS